jgi:hypothetical protein
LKMEVTGSFRASVTTCKSTQYPNPKHHKKNSRALVHQRTIPTEQPPLIGEGSSGQSSWLRIQRSRVQFPTLPDFLRSSGSGTGSTQPREDNWGATCKDSSGCGLENRN